MGELIAVLLSNGLFPLASISNPIGLIPIRLAMATSEFPSTRTSQKQKRLQALKRCHLRFLAITSCTFIW